MTTAKYIGIWMDHSHANLIEFSRESMETKVVESEFTAESKENSLGKSEHVMHNKEQHQQLDFYKKLSEVIRNYEAVLLFGPTDAKSELSNFLEADHRFEKISIKTQSADKLTEPQQHALVREYFANLISKQ
jgi:stalled ribosome rescue protein Dom34